MVLIRQDYRKITLAEMGSTKVHNRNLPGCAVDKASSRFCFGLLAKAWTRIWHSLGAGVTSRLVIGHMTGDITALLYVSTPGEAIRQSSQM